MNCETLCDHLLELTDGSIAPALEAECRAHLVDCPSCALEVARHRASWRLLGEISVEKTSPARLKQMAATALAAARATPEAPETGLVPDRGGAPSSPGSPRLLRRRIVRVATAAALVLATALGTEWVLRSRNLGAGPDAPDCLADPEFVGDFEVLRDLPDMDDDAADGELLDLDHDEVVMLQLCDDV